MKNLSLKQEALMRSFLKGELKRLNILQGSVRSGKTYISLILWAAWVLDSPKDKNYLMTAKTLTSLKRNCLELLEDLVGGENFSYSLTKKEGILFGRKIHLEGVSDLRSEGKIRGLTLMGAYCDELSLFTEDFFSMLLSRLSEPGARLFATTNPDNPHHWLKEKYINRAGELDLKVYNFLIDDNSFLPPDYIRELKKEYTGVYYDRFISGLWKAAEGVIYPLFANSPKDFLKKVPPEIVYATIGVDFGGNKSAHAFVLSGFTRGLKEVVILDEFYLNEVVSPARLEEYFINFVKKSKEKYPVFEAWCDNAETTLIEGLRSAVARENVAVDVRPAIKGNVVNRIRLTNSLMSHGSFFVMEHCHAVIEALSCAVWDDSSHDDKRLDDFSYNVDSLDAMEYSIEPVVQA